MTTWRKQPPPIDVNISNQQLEARFYFSDAEVPELRFMLMVSNGVDSTRADVPVAGALSAAEQAALTPLLVKLRDAALADIGFSKL